MYNCVQVQNVGEVSIRIANETFIEIYSNKPNPMSRKWKMSCESTT